ncbi:T-complex protein 1, epsilon subunit [Plasmodium falciparum Santa Lucia]|uniref:T-complex protein 1 subunit epsilon n=16 Tax=Plasmodium falciparum TaxID=5833 RepID=O97282_PLAF7|nr:T-complex protein 1 subunit epsilon [Plasmodium falciparum 3D7]ETW20526.1 T-complex protein 1, epsilon subunit [Plasmodium falciparum Vietnam Oak-Knoll (FVO)]ETW32313.1 T-complex protein 1, epsilon subunit [Plasmodium falciparum FCH/4]ETW38651.1 T-complex protein 1, epsilon subunit [Plasmodium falciparum Tanzania (2000708)]ETW45019.1 T-complex protein 1, epsilon subunit [Plasmodium falciparum NF135/5.C10]ETW51418.1 T-complex protein 1, epsilon subunit [Plasmodium falciparum MaliPS096_E11]E|eukprot:XP_001351273.1 T-complex protein 1 subunit epsilon [Plasmodium falciparum 3D7]
MNIAIDEYGQPFVILREEEKKRIKGIEAHKSNILAAKVVADILKSSIGPRGMDKIIVSEDNNVTVTNDGATILEKIDVQHECAKLLVELSKSQDNEIGDGTTGVVIIAGVLLEEAYALIDKGIHPLRIADGFENACNIALKVIEDIALTVDIEENDHKILKKVAKTSLSSKIVSSKKDLLSNIVVDAVLSVADMKRKDVRFDLIKIEGKTGGLLEESTLIKGIVLNKELSHSQMIKEVRNAKIAILTCPFEPPKPKIKHKLNITNVDAYRDLQAIEKKYFYDMVASLKKAGANFVICQWGFDDEANYLLLKENIPAIRWVGGVEMELIAIATGGKIIPRFEDIDESKLGKADLIREISHGTVNNPMVYIEGCSNTKAITILLRGGNQMMIEECERSVHDALCSVRNLIRDNRILPGGGSTEIYAALEIEKVADKCKGIEQYAIRAFGNALLSIPINLCNNMGLNSIDIISEIKTKIIQDKTKNLGIDCLNYKVGDMIERGIFETFNSKYNQFSLATQVVKMILKIDDVIAPNDFN